MNIFKLAKKREKAMEELYLRIADLTKNVGLKGLFLDLASSEGAHLSTFSSLEEQKGGVPMEEVEVDMALTLREINLRKDFLEAGLSQLDLYRKVRDYELESQKFYEALLARAHTSSLKEVLKEMAAEEQSHVTTMDNIIDLVSLPEALRDDAEFGISASDIETMGNEVI